MALISSRTIERIRDIPLQKVVNDFSDVTMVNNDSCCPFPDHEDKNASFHVETKNNIWTCFSSCSGSSGSRDAIGLLQGIRGLSFPDAVDELCSRYSIVKEYDEPASELSKEQKKAYAISQSIVETNSKTSKLYAHSLASLPADHPVKSYLKTRGLDAKICHKWGVADRVRKKVLSEAIKSLGN